MTSQRKMTRTKVVAQELSYPTVCERRHHGAGLWRNEEDKEVMRNYIITFYHGIRVNFKSSAMKNPKVRTSSLPELKRFLHKEKSQKQPTAKQQHLQENNEMFLC